MALAHLVSKTHLDVGFTDLGSAVVDRYVTQYIPAALELAAELRQRGETRFVWTTGSWLVHTFLERATPEQRAQAEAAIAAGDLAWHALPFTLHTELCDVPLVEAGLGIAARLDERFGRRTIAAKMTDVPGHTRGLVPLLASAGVELLHIGVNPGSTTPEVPGAFRWQVGEDEVSVVYQAGSYGDLTEVPGCDDRLVFAHTGDNRGPQSAEEYLAEVARWRERLPGFEVQGSTLDAFAAALRPVRAGLPVLTAEIGDSWIHGSGADPRLVADLRALLRVRRSWLASGRVGPDDERLRGFHENLLLVCEHTWGMDEKTFLTDTTHYRRDQLDELRADEHTQAFEASFEEKRALVPAALAALPDELASEARDALADAPVLHTADVALPVRLGSWTVAVTEDGPVVYCPDCGRAVADAGHPVGRLVHQAYAEADYNRFLDQYIRPDQRHERWPQRDFAKEGIDACGARSASWTASFGPAQLGGDMLVLPLVFPGEATDAYGAPVDAELRLWDASDAESRALGFEVCWQTKHADRLPEATWLQVHPGGVRGKRLLLDKLGQEIDPHDVVPGGGRHLHAVGEGVRWVDGPRLTSLDAPLVAPGARRLLDFAPDLPDTSLGVWVNLLNNVWGTNFPQWVEGPARFRFLLDVGSHHG